MRLLAGSLAPAILLSRFPAGHAAIWEDSLAPSLHLMPCLLAAVDPGVRVDVPSAAHAESSLRLAVEVAVHSEELETECVVLILGHAAYAPDHSGLCRWALELLAAKMGYGSRQQYLAYHMQVGLCGCTDRLAYQDRSDGTDTDLPEWGRGPPDTSKNKLGA